MVTKNNFNKVLMIVMAWMIAGVLITAHEYFFLSNYPGVLAEHAMKMSIRDRSDTALLSNASACANLFGTPNTSIEQMIDIIADWILQGGKTMNKPTHFNEREGNF